MTVKKSTVVKDKATDKGSDVLVGKEKAADITKEKDKKLKLKFKVTEPVKTTPMSLEKKYAKVLSEASVLEAGSGGNSNEKEIETDEENESKLSKKGKKEKVLTPDEIRHQDYVKKLPILQARTAPTALHTAIHGVKNVDIQKFLVEIGFNSFIKFDISKIPARLGRYVVENFDAETCRLKLEHERFIEATVTKVHELLGILIGDQYLLSLETRLVGDDFENVWLGQFEGKSAKQIRVNDIANKLIESKEVDFLFKVNFLTLFTNTMGMVAGLQGEINFDVVKHNKYTGPYTLLARHEMELKEEYIGMSELYDESELPETEGFVAGCSSNTSYKKELLNNLEEKLAVISNERAC
ncbi:hypothetical protein CTI12_AA363040 [Artemisia annua]|uniref:Ulp1 protease family, C-terminal catalytic domain-containing protein n=1 Tax=Artemisia annua TaxID=35608 RepID=A0A2U1MMP3_ARTAN|nr:hypothetical protein CTI12_AA363040 [Artemisia annua]